MANQPIPEVNAFEPKVIMPSEAFPAKAQTEEDIAAQTKAMGTLMEPDPTAEPTSNVIPSPRTDLTPAPAPEAPPAPPSLSVTEQHTENMRRETSFERAKDATRKQANATPIPGKGAADTVKELREGYTAEQTAARKAEAASPLPVRFARWVGRRLGLVPEPLYTKPPQQP